MTWTAKSTPLLLTLTIACGPNASVSGSVGGKSLAAGDSLVTYGINDDMSPGAVILIGSDSSLCSNLADPTASFRPGQESLTIVLTEQLGGSLIAPTTGEFTISAEAGGVGQNGTATFNVAGATACAASTSATATSGSVSVTAVNLASGGSIQGTFTLDFPSGTLTGSFDSPLCSAPPGAVCAGGG